MSKIVNKVYKAVETIINDDGGVHVTKKESIEYLQRQTVDMIADKHFGVALELTNDLIVLNMITDAYFNMVFKNTIEQ